MFPNLDPLLHSELRLAIMSLLISHEQADFNFLKEHTKATSGNLSTQISKLKEAEYIYVEKGFKANFPYTLCKITPLGIDRFETYVSALQTYLTQHKIN
ncbi:MAG: transcriptional regulator [Chitinophagales bacterium]|jgi:DNA-binding transcriptional ArsR family regulator|nr:transcriptional regulator [Chitinophagales bacterium]